MSLKFIASAVARRFELACRFFALLFVATITVGSANAQTETITYTGEVDMATGAFVALTPVGTPVGGPLVVDSTALAAGSIGVADIVSIDVNVGGFCFATGAGDCSGVGTLVPITSIDSAAITGSSGNLGGSFAVTAFSPTFMVSIPISFDLDSGTFFADGGALGTVGGTGALAGPPAPDIDTDPAVGTPIDFGSVVTESGQVSQTITVSNLGNLLLTISSVDLMDEPADLTITDGCTGTLSEVIGMVTDTCTITLNLNPITAGPIAASVVITSDDADEAVTTINVIGEIVLPAALTSTAPMGSPLMPDSVAIGGTSTGTITVTNTGGVAAVLGTATMPAAPFSITSDLCSTQTLAPDSVGTCDIVVQFAPTVAGNFQESFSIGVNAPVLANGGGAVSTTMFVTSSTLDPAATASANPLMIADTMVNSTGTGTLTITNSGDADLVVTGATGLVAPFSADASACTAAPVPPGNMCDIVVSFAPTAEVVSMGTLVVASNDPASPLEVDVMATGTEELLPNIMLTPASLVFATPVLIGASATESITVSNMGTADLAISAIATDPNPSNDFTLGDDCGVTLAPSASCTITVTFAPTAGGPLTASVTVASDDADTPLATVAVSGTGVVPEPNIMLSTALLDLGVETVGNSTMGTVIVSNLGTANLSITSVTLPVGDYTQTNDCTAAALLPMATCTISVTFAPTSDATITDTITIVSNDPDSMTSQVALTGRGVSAPEPNISSDVTSVDFGTGLFGETIDRSVVVTNNGSAALVISAVAITGVDAAEFAVGGDCVVTLAVGTQCTATVQFAPAAPAGAKSAALSVTSNDADTPTFDVALAGVAEEPVPAAMLSATTVTFADTITGDSNTETVTITNSGTGPLSVTNVAFPAGAGPDFTVMSDTCSAGPVAVDATCDIVIAFAPSAEGALSSTLTIDSDDPANPSQSVSVSGQGVAAPVPDITADVMTLPFGSVQFADSGMLILTVTNQGDADLTISGATVAPAGDFSATTACGVLAPAAACTVEVTYAPTVEGDVTATLSVASDDPDTPSLDIALTGTGVPLEPEIELSATDLMFGSIVVGTTGTLDVIVSNTGMADLFVGSVTLSGAGQASFSQANDCATVAMNESCTVTVTFEPSAIGDSTATLTIVSNDADEGSVDVALTGTATPVPMPMLSVASTLDLGEVESGQAASGTITVSNLGMADLVVSNVSITGEPQFTQTNACATIAANGTCDIEVEFTPLSDGAVTANVVITSNDAASPATVTVSATGSVPVPMTSTDVLDLGGVRIGESGNAAVTISNTGSADLVVISAVLTGPDAADFTLANACATVAPGATCTITADFTPTSEGAKMAAITVTTNDPALATFDIALSATGAPMEEVVVSVSSSGGSGALGLLELGGLLLFVALVRRFSARALVIAVAAVCAPLSMADNHEGPSRDGYWYAGAGFGSSDGQADLGGIERGIEDAGVTVTSLDIDDSDSGYKLFAGYQASEHLAVEVGYVDLGEAGIDLQLGDVTLDDLPLISRSVSGNLSLLGSGVFGAVVARQTFSERFGVFAKLGLVSWEVDTDIGGGTSMGALNIKETESGTDFMFGLGAEAWFGEGQKFGVRGEWERFELGEQDAEFLSLGVMYRF